MNGNQCKEAKVITMISGGTDILLSVPKKETIRTDKNVCATLLSLRITPKGFYSKAQGQAA